MAQATIHICLISDHLLPNLIPVLMARPAWVHLIVSDAMRANGRRFQKLLAKQNIAFQEHLGVPSTGLTELRDYADRVALAIDDAHPDATVVLNATGGTKLMALAFVEAFRQMNAKVIYTDTEHNRLEFLSKEPQPIQPLVDVLDIETYLAAYGFTVRQSGTDSDGWRNRAVERKPLSKWLAREAVHIGDLLGALNKLAVDALDGGGEILREPAQKFSAAPYGHWRSALDAIKTAGLLSWDGAEWIHFTSADGARYLSGFWLEEYAWHIVHDQKPAEVRSGVVGTWEGKDKRNASRNEFDLLTVHHNRMLVVECKTAAFGRDEGRDSDILYKLDSLGRNAGGLFGKTLLLSARRLTDSVRARAESHGIDILEGDRLSKLRDYVRRWMAEA